MKLAEYYSLDNKYRYIFKCYHGKIYYGILVEYHKVGTNSTINCIVENPKIKEFNNPNKSVEDKIKERIMIPINIETISDWEKQKK